MTVECPDGVPSVAAAAQQLGVQAGDLDPDFGVVLVDPRRHLYSVLVRADRLPASSPGDGDEDFHGPYANPRIAPFGPVRPADDAPAADPEQPEQPE